MKKEKDEEEDEEEEGEEEDLGSAREAVSQVFRQEKRADRKKLLS